MTKPKIILTAIIVIAAVLIFNSYSSARIINISVANFSFTPSSVTNAVVGDTIQWTRTSGSHTTTCNGTNGTTRPAGAVPWDAPLNSGTSTFRYIIQVAGIYNYVCTPHAPDMSGTISASASSITQINEIAAGFKISQNYPNPFNPSTKINFAIPKSSQVVLKIYDNNGKEVSTLVNARLNAATYETEWNASDVNSGVYYYRIQADNFTETRKMLLIK